MSLLKRKYRIQQQALRSGEIKFLPQYKKWYQLKWSSFKTREDQIDVTFPELFQGEEFLRAVITNEVVFTINHNYDKDVKPKVAGGFDIYV